jgi:hypothetical protein
VIEEKTIHSIAEIAKEEKKSVTCLKFSYVEAMLGLASFACYNIKMPTDHMIDQGGGSGYRATPP